MLGNIPGRETTVKKTERNGVVRRLGILLAPLILGPFLAFGVLALYADYQASEQRTRAMHLRMAQQLTQSLDGIVSRMRLQAEGLIGSGLLIGSKDTVIAHRLTAWRATNLDVSSVYWFPTQGEPIVSLAFADDKIKIDVAILGERKEYISEVLKEVSGQAIYYHLWSVPDATAGRHGILVAAVRLGAWAATAKANIEHEQGLFAALVSNGATGTVIAISTAQDPGFWQKIADIRRIGVGNSIRDLSDGTHYVTSTDLEALPAQLVLAQPARLALAHVQESLWLFVATGLLMSGALTLVLVR